MGIFGTIVAIWIVGAVLKGLTGGNTRHRRNKRRARYSPTRHCSFSSRTGVYKSHQPAFNPANGLPMLGSFDIEGNPYGFDTISSFHSSSDSFHSGNDNFHSSWNDHNGFND